MNRNFFFLSDHISRSQITVLAIHRKCDLYAEDDSLSEFMGAQGASFGFWSRKRTPWNTNKWLFPVDLHPLRIYSLKIVRLTCIYIPYYMMSCNLFSERCLFCVPYFIVTLFQVWNHFSFFLSFFKCYLQRHVDFKWKEWHQKRTRNVS